MNAKRLRAVAVLVAALAGVLPGGLWAQTPAQTTGPQTKNDDVTALKALLAEQQKQIDQLKSALEDQKKMIERVSSNTPSPAPVPAPEKQDFTLPRDKALGEVASTTPYIPAAAAVPKPVATPIGAPVAEPVAAPAAAIAQTPADQIPTSPLQLKIGDAYIIPIGFMDFTTEWRSHDGGSGIGTNFAGIPYGNVFQNNLPEWRESMQNSRIGFRVDALVKGAHVIGYMESDFLGNNPGNVAVTSNSNTMRSRLYWVDVRKSGWELLGGQTWSLMTPNRSGISPLPGNIFFSQDMDVNYQAGLTWGRIPELRLGYHGNNDKWAFAFALDSPEQYVGGSAGAPTITFPSALSSTYTNELNTGGNTLGVPNFAPDLIAKLAFDPSAKFHAEVVGLARTFRVWNPTSSKTYTANGGGGSINLNFALYKGFRLITNNFWSDGGGRYLFGMVPDLIVRSNGDISPIHTGSTVSGFEWTVRNSLIYSYYGGTYISRNTALDTNGKPIGYGFLGSSSAQNRNIQELTGGWIQTFWRDAKYGQLSLITQYSYLSRNPWYIAPGQPEDAHVNMIFLDLRYTLPGSAPTLGVP